MAQQDAQNGRSKNVVSLFISSPDMKPQLLVKAPKANEAVLFYKAAFGAEEVGRTMNPKRKAGLKLPLILSAELKIGGSSILIADLVEDSTSEAKTRGNGFALCLETEDVEGAIKKAVSAGAVEVVGGERVCCGGCGEGEGSIRICLADMFSKEEMCRHGSLMAARSVVDHV